MKKIKGSICAKIAAWIGITVSAVVFAGSVLGAALLQEIDVYETPRENMEEELLKAAAGQSAVRALDHWINRGGMLLEDEPYFRYGIIKAEEIDDLDLNKDSTYEGRTFTEQVSPDDLYAFSYEIADDAQFSYSGTIWGGYGIYNNHALEYGYEEIQNIVYNADDGTYYYETTGHFFPVRSLEVSYAGEVYSYEYDFQKKMYRRQEAAVSEAEEAEEMEVEKAATSEEMGIEENADTAGNVSETPFSDMTVTELLEQEYFSFNMIEQAGIAYDEWGNYGITVSSGEYGANGEPLLAAPKNAEYFEGRVAATTEYYLETEYTLGVSYEYDAGCTTYWVVAVKPENVGTGWSRDLFVQAKELTDLIYNLRYSIYVIMAASVVLGIICFVFLIAAAGHRKGTDEICETAIDSVPFDVYLLLAAMAEGFLLFLMIQLSYSAGYFTEYLLLGFLGLCMGWVALKSVLTFAVRVKTKRWWTNTVICRILRWIRKGVHFLLENFPLLGKAILFAGVVLFIDLVLMLMAASSGGSFLLLWLAEKAVLTGLFFLAVVQMKKLEEGGEKIADGDLSYQIDAEKMFSNFRKHGENLNRIGEGMSRAVDERMKSERFKTELITNVSHDIKTPLTSIINYVDLLEKEEMQNETAEEYLEVLERQSGRLKKLIEDLIEASKASSGALPVHKEKLDAAVFMVQTVGEFEEKTNARNLELIIKKTETPVYIMADGRHFWRIIDNLMNNICKYAQPSTRVYINMEVKADKAYMTFRNTSKYPLNITSEELMERFVRGDASRNTEGSGLGLSIAKSLTELMGGAFHLYVDGDLFKVELVFPVCRGEDADTLV